jgi:hypothetical protein
MNESASIFLATTVLALGGLGLYLFKSSDKQKGGDKYNEDEIFDDKSDESLSDSDSDSELDYEPEPKKPKTKNAAKTKRNKKSGGTKRKY